MSLNRPDQAQLIMPIYAILIAKVRKKNKKVKSFNKN